MIKAQVFPKALAAMGFFASTVLSKACYSNVVSEVSSQEDLDKIFLSQNCTEITGGMGISIKEDYKGPFSLPGVTVIEGGLTTGPSYRANVSVLGLTELHMDDLTTMGFFALGPSSVKSLTLPKLANTTAIYVAGGKTSAIEVNFPWLEFSHLHFSGNLSGINLPNLTRSESFYVESYNSNYSISLPALMTVKAFSLTGNFTSLSLPVLENVTGYLLVEPLEKADLDYDFPALKRGSGDTPDIALYSAKSLKMPLLETVRSLYIQMTTKDQLITLPTLINASDIDITGSVNDIQLPALNHLFKSLEIRSTAKINCTSAQVAYSRAKKNGAIAPVYVCEKIKGPRLTRSQKDGLGIGLGLGLGMFAVVGLAFGLRWLKERKKGKVFKELRGNGGVEQGGVKGILKDGGRSKVTAV